MVERTANRMAQRAMRVVAARIMAPSHCLDDSEAGIADRIVPTLSAIQ